MRRVSTLLALMAMVGVTALPAGAHTEYLSGPNPAIWLSDPDGVDGVAGTEQFDGIVGSSGTAQVGHGTARIQVNATGLAPGHTYTMWVVYFNDKTLCVAGCNGADLPISPGGVIYGDGRVAAANGTATFTARLADGDGGEYVGQFPPPPFAFGPFQAGSNNEFHIVIRSHGPVVPGLLRSQTATFDGGCESEVGPLPEQVGDFPVPSAIGECGDVQLYVFG